MENEKLIHIQNAGGDTLTELKNKIRRGFNSTQRNDFQRKQDAALAGFNKHNIFAHSFYDSMPQMAVNELSRIRNIAATLMRKLEQAEVQPKQPEQKI
jgi:hypothetical protein